MTTFIVFPNSLFDDVDHLRKYDTIFVVEEPIFFGHDKKYRDYNINKVKLAYMRASMRHYYDRLRDRFQDVRYVNYSDVNRYEFLDGGKTEFFDPVDFDLEKKLNDMKVIYAMLDTQLFPVPTQEIVEYFTKRKIQNSKKISQGGFYKWIKNKLSVLESVGSKDTENRKALPKKHGFVWSTPNFATGELQPYYAEAKEWVRSHKTFKNNIGTTDNIHLYPISTSAAQQQFRDFLRHRIQDFGPYEDAIDKDEVVLFHSLVSAPLNNGLLSSAWAIKTVIKEAEHIPINSLEGWIRQLIGWRTFMFGVYKVFYRELQRADHFHQKRKLRWAHWYGAKKIGIEILDNEIEKAMAFGYAHHIPRLMVFLNAFVLMEVRSRDVVRWFSEVVAIDASHWVMWSNIASMGYYDTRFMAKPYISGSAYLSKMSNYPKGDWTVLWTDLFYRFLYEHKKDLTGGAAVYLRNLSYFEKKGTKERMESLESARRFISEHTTK
jgi:deoxyribodipyrimidine photolyase-related protein